MFQAKLFSLKCDIASRNGKSFLGVNAQYISNGRLQLRTLSAKLLGERHTGDYLLRVIKEILKEYDVSGKNIYSCTTDNGANMIKLVNLLQDETTQELSNPDSNEEADNQTDSTLMTALESINDGIGDNTPDDAHEESFDEDNAPDDNPDDTPDDDVFTLACVRCAAHTLQLCVCGMLKKHMDSGVIPKVNIFLLHIVPCFTDNKPWLICIFWPKNRT